MSNLSQVLSEIKVAAEACGRLPSDIKLVAVTKSVSWTDASYLYEEGQRDFAENRLQNAIEKISEAPKDSLWHLIGTLQSNKVKKTIGRFQLIHSVDSFELLKKISDCSVEMGVVTSVLLQVNTSGEISKHGMKRDECFKMFSEMLLLPNINIQGLMTMAPLTDNEDLVRKCFRDLYRLKEDLNKAFQNQKLYHLSMGMSHDFKLAIAEGATIVRIGTRLFNKNL